MSDADTRYVIGVAIPGVLVVFGAGVAFPPIIGATTVGVGPRRARGGLRRPEHDPHGRRRTGLAVLATVAASRTSHAPTAGRWTPTRSSRLPRAYLVAAGAMLLAAALGPATAAAQAAADALPPIPTRTHADQVA